MADIAEIQVQFLKDPVAVRAYYRDWSYNLDAGESIVSSTWTVSANDVTILLEEMIGAQKTAVWLSGGIAGDDYTVSNEITTDASPVPNVDKRSFLLVVRDR